MFFVFAMSVSWSHASTEAALASMVSTHYGWSPMRPHMAYVAQMVPVQDLRTVVCTVRPHLAAALLAVIHNLSARRRDERLAALRGITLFKVYDHVAGVGQRYQAEVPVLSFYVRAGANYFVCYSPSADTALARAYVGWTPEKHLEHMPMRVRHAVRTLLLVFCRLRVRFGTGLRLRIVRTCVYADWLFMMHVQRYMNMDTRALAVEWGGAKRVSTERMMHELGDRGSTMELMGAGVNMGDTTDAVSPNFRTYWAMRQYGACARLLGITLPEDDGDAFLRAVLLDPDTSVLRRFCELCGMENISVDMLWPYIQNGVMAPRGVLFRLASQVARNKADWMRLDDHWSPHRAYAVSRGLGWYSNACNVWRQNWIDWSLDAHERFPNMFTIAFRAQVRMLGLWLGRRTPLHVRVARELSRAHYIMHVHPTANATKNANVQYAKHWNLPNVTKSMGAVEIQRIVDEHYQLVQLIKWH